MYIIWGGQGQTGAHKMATSHFNEVSVLQKLLIPWSYLDQKGSAGSSPDATVSS
jgi:hypothetical protein